MGTAKSCFETNYEEVAMWICGSSSASSGRHFLVDDEDALAALSPANSTQSVANQQACDSQMTKLPIAQRERSSDPRLAWASVCCVPLHESNAWQVLLRQADAFSSSCTFSEENL